MASGRGMSECEALDRLHEQFPMNRNFLERSRLREKVKQTRGKLRLCITGFLFFFSLFFITLLFNHEVLLDMAYEPVLLCLSWRFFVVTAQSYLENKEAALDLWSGYRE